MEPIERKHIIINEKICNKCNTCSEVCVTKIIEPANEQSFPEINKENVENCIKCGHCEAFCPSEALLLNYNIKDKIIISPLEGQIDSENLALYLKKRRSVRHFSPNLVDKKTIHQMIDVASYAASAGNSQTVRWIVIYDPKKVKHIAKLTIEWMRTLINTSHPLANYVPMIISIWDKGNDYICHNAPHILFAHLPKMDPIDDRTDAIIALTHFDISAPAFGIGSCWAGFVKMAVDAYKPLQDYIKVPEGRKISHAMLFGYSTYKAKSIPRRKPISITWE